MHQTQMTFVYSNDQTKTKDDTKAYTNVLINIC